LKTVLFHAIRPLSALTINIAAVKLHAGRYMQNTAAIMGRRLESFVFAQRDSGGNHRYDKSITKL